MRCWSLSPSEQAGAPLWAPLIERLGQPAFEQALLREVNDWVPAASYALYRTGMGCVPQLFLSSSIGVEDRTQSCWQAYCQSLYLSDHTLDHPARPTAPSHATDGAAAPTVWLRHVTAAEVPPLHRQRIYEAHGLRERLSLCKRLPQGGVLALNYYRHSHQRAFSDKHIANLETIAPTLLTMVEKHLEWTASAPSTSIPKPDGTAAPHPRPHTHHHWQQQLLAHCPALTAREQQVCVHLLQGLTYEGIAAQLGLSVPTVKTYRNRAFQRLGIHFRNQLFALVQPAD